MIKVEFNTILVLKQYNICVSIIVLIKIEIEIQGGNTNGRNHKRNI